MTIRRPLATAADPVGSGFVASLARPGGSITGFSQLNVELSGKRAELLREAIPFQKAVVLSLEADDAAPMNTSKSLVQETERRGRALGLDCECSKCARRTISRQHLVVSIPSGTGVSSFCLGPMALAHASTIAELALKQKLPAVYSRNFAESGGLMSYGVDLDDQMRHAAMYVDRILKGARPARAAARMYGRGAATTIHLVRPRKSLLEGKNWVGWGRMSKALAGGQ